jgi:phosphohistidine phosphatase
MMARELWLMRHGKAKRFEGLEDYDRPLKKSGKRASKLVGEWLNSNGLRPDLVISSPAARALSTALVVCGVVGIDPLQVKQEKRLYDEGLVRVKAVLADCPATFRRVLVVGHNPELEELFTYLARSGTVPDRPKLLPTGALVRLGMPDDWSKLAMHCAEALSITYPKSLGGEEGGIDDDATVSKPSGSDRHRL